MEEIFKITCFLWILLTIKVLPASSRSYPIPRPALRGPRSINMGFRTLEAQKSMFPAKYENSIVRKGAETPSFLIILIPKDASFRKRLPSKQELKDRRLKYLNTKQREYGYQEYLEPKPSVDENAKFEFVGQPRAFKFSDLKDRGLKKLNKEGEYGYKEYAEPNQSVDENAIFEYYGQPKSFKFSDLVA